MQHWFGINVSEKLEEHRRMFAEAKVLGVTISKDVKDNFKKMVVETKEYSILVLWWWKVGSEVKFKKCA